MPMHVQVRARAKRNKALEQQVEEMNQMIDSFQSGVARHDQQRKSMSVKIEQLKAQLEKTNEVVKSCSNDALFVLSFYKDVEQALNEARKGGDQLLEQVDKTIRTYNVQEIDLINRINPTSSSSV